MTSGARVFVVALVFALVPLAAGTAGATTLSDPPSSVSQYIEIPPSAGGKIGNKAAPLSQVSARALSATGNSAASALRDVATSTALGAPNATLSLSKSGRWGMLRVRQPVSQPAVVETRMPGMRRAYLRGLLEPDEGAALPGARRARRNRRRDGKADRKKLNERGELWDCFQTHVRP